MAGEIYLVARTCLGAIVSLGMIANAALRPCREERGVCFQLADQKRFELRPIHSIRSRISVRQMNVRIWRTQQGQLRVICVGSISSNHAYPVDCQISAPANSTAFVEPFANWGRCRRRSAWSRFECRHQMEASVARAGNRAPISAIGNQPDEHGSNHAYPVGCQFGVPMIIDRNGPSRFSALSRDWPSRTASLARPTAFRASCQPGDWPSPAASPARP